MPPVPPPVPRPMHLEMCRSPLRHQTPGVEYIPVKLKFHQKLITSVFPRGCPSFAYMSTSQRILIFRPHKLSYFLSTLVSEKKPGSLVIFE